MPSAVSIVQDLTSIANEWWRLAAAWHVYLLVPVVTVLFGLRWSKAAAAAWLVPPAASVATVAWMSGSPFNGVVFAALAVVLASAAFNMRRGGVSPARGMAVLPGLALLLFGLTYPHFLRVTSWTEFVYAAPVGLLPCPTLAALIGVTLILNLFEDRAWGRTLAVAGLAYGAIGAFRLGVTLDLALIGGAAWLAWAIVKPRSVRATNREAATRLPGDDLIPAALDRLTHAITIRRPRRDVWPWLAQMGAGTRAGWYSYDFLDNARKPSATRLVPELQPLERGMLFPALPHVTDGFTLLDFDPERSLVLGFQRPGAAPEVTWAFQLEDVDRDATRLVVRASGGPGYRFKGLPVALTRPLIRCVHFVMERKQLLGIATRAEALPQ